MLDTVKSPGLALEVGGEGSVGLWSDSKGITADAFPLCCDDGLSDLDWLGAGNDQRNGEAGQHIAHP